MVPLADSTIYEMEQRGEFPRRFSLSPRCVVWDLAEVQAWLDARRAESRAGKRTPSHPNVRLRRTRPVKG